MGFSVQTPRGEIVLSAKEVADAAERLRGRNEAQRLHAAKKADAVLAQRDSRRAAAIRAATTNFIVDKMRS